MGGELSTAGGELHEGVTAPGYETVREVFARGIRGFSAGGACFAAYVHGQPVVDLWGGMAGPGQPWERDTLAVMMSSTKGLVGLCAQILSERGQLEVDVPVSRYWPEFAQNGKGAVLVSHVLTHSAGILELPRDLVSLGWDGRGWDDHEAIAAALAAARPLWAAGEGFGYHALTYGWLVGELVRRVTGKSLGEEKPRFGPNPRAFGHDGLGGQIAFCDPDARVAVGFLRSELTASSRFSTKLIDAVYRCETALETRRRVRV